VALQNTGATAIALTFGNGGGANSGSTATNGTYTGVLSGGGSLTKIGDNTEIFSGASTYTGPTTINAGTLELNFAQSGAPSTNILYNGVTPGALTIGGVASSTQTLNNPNITLNVASASTGNQSQTFASLTLNTGYDTISTTDNGTGNVLVTLNGITQNAGSVLNVNAAGTASSTNAVTTTNSNDATGILGGWAVVGGGTGYATVNGSGQIVAYAGYDNIGTGTTITDDGGTTTNANVEMQPSSGATVTLSGATNGATNINTLFYNATNSAAVSLTSGTLRLGANGGILDNAAGKTFTISGGTLTAGGSTLNTAGTLSIIDTSANNNAISISSVIANNNTSTGAANSSGAGAVTLTIAGGSYDSGNNSVTLSGANTYSGGTYLDGGRIVSTNVASFGTGQVTVMPGAQAFLDVAGTYANAFNIAGIGQGENGYASAIRFVVGGITLSGQVTLLGDASIQNQGGTDTISGGITGNYNLNLYGSANDVTILSGATTIGGNLGINGFIPGVSFGGGTTFTVEVTNAAGLDSGSSTGNVIMNGSTGGLILDIHGVSTSINGLVGIGLNASQTEVTNLAASGNNATLTLGNNNATATFGGNIVQTTGDGTLAIVKTGGGTQVLAGSGDTFTGGLTINQGTIQDANSNSGVLGTGNVTFGASNTPTLDLDGNSATTGLLAGAGANGIITDSAASTTSTLTLTGAGSQTFGGSIQNGSGTVALTLVSGTQTLTGANTYTGATTVYYPGVLNIGGGGATGSINSGSALVLNGGSLAFNETGSPTQTFAGTTIGSAVAGTGGLGNSNVTSASGDTLVLGALTRATGSGGVNFGGAGVIDTTTANQAGTGILGGYATFSGSTWAVSAGTGSAEGQITGLASSAYTLTSTAGSVAANYAGGNIDVNSSPDLAGAVSASSVRFNTAAPETFSLTGTNVFAAGAMLVTSNVGSNTSTIAGGTIEGGGGEFVINQENTAGGLNIFSAIADDGVPTALTLDGGGSVTLFGANTYTGATAISGGGLTLDGGSLGSTAVTINAGTFTDNGSTGSGGSLTINSGATLAGVGTVSGNVTLNPGGIINFGDGGVIGGTLTIPTGVSGVANWNGLGAVNGATTVTGSGTLAIGSGAIMTAPGGVTLNGASVLNITGMLAGSVVINSSVTPSTSGVIAGSASSVTINGGGSGELLGNNSFGGGLFINNGTLYENTGGGINANVLGSGNITFGASNSPTLNFRVSNGSVINTGLLVGSGNNGIIEESFANGNEAFLALNGTGTATYNGQVIQGGGVTRDIGITMNGGTEIFGGTGLAGLANITVNNGTFQLGNGTSGSPNLDTTAPNAIAVAGGTFILESQNNSTQYTASVGNLSVNSGGSTIQDNNLGTGGDLLTLGSITRAIGGTVNFILPTGAVSSTNGITTTTVNTAAGIIGGYATVGGTDWAINSTNASGGNIAGLSSGAGYTASTAGTTTPGVTTSNIDFQNSNTNSWNSSTVNSLRFNSTTSGTLSITAANTLTVTSGGILVTANVGSNATGISGGSITSSGTDLIIIQNNTSAGFTISSLITATGADGLTKSGAGLLTLNPGSANTFTGAITLNGGILNTTQNGIGSAGSFVFNGGTLQANGAISTSKAITLNYAGGGGTFDTNGTSSTFSGAISGGGGLTVIGSGTATLSYATGNTFTGGLTINNTATVVDTVNHTGQLGAGVLTFGANGTLDLSTGAGPTVAGLSATNSGALITNITNNTSTITLNGASNYSYAGAINNGDGGLGVIALTVNLNNPTQVQTLGGADTYTGATTITQGSLDLSNALAVQDSTVTLNGGGLIFDQSVTANSNAFTLGGLAGSAALTLQNNASTPAAVSVSVGNNNANTAYSGILTGPGSLTKIGTGSLTLSGGAFYTGATSVNSGTLALTGTLVGTTSIATSGAGSFTESSAGIIAGAAGFTQGSSATSTLGGVNLYTGATSATNGTLSLNGMLNGTPSVTTSAAGAFSETSTGTIAGAGTTFSQGSSATSTLGGVNSYTGATSVSAGTLNLTGMLNGTPSVTTSGAGAFTESSTGVIAGAATTFTQGSTATSTLGGVNTYTGATFINAGVLDLATASSISTGNITFGGGTLQYGQGTNSQDYSSQIVNSTGAISVDTNDNSITWSSSLASSNTGGLTVMDSSGLGGFGGNSGNLTLNAVDNYGGATTVEGGAYLADGVSGGLPSGTVLNIGGTVNGYSGGTFDIDGNNQTVSGLVSLGNGSSDLLTNNGGGNAVLTISGVGGTYAGQIQDGSSYIGIALASGTETLSGNASSLSYSNGTTVSGGRLIVSGSLSGGGAVNVTGGTLEVDGSVNNALTINVSSGGTLEGTGSVGGISTSGAGSSFDPGLSAANSTTSTGTLIANGNVTLDPTAFNIRLGLSASGTDSDELVEGGSGRVNLENSTLNLTLGSGVANLTSANIDNLYYVIINGGSQTVLGTFNGDPNGTIVSATSGGNTWQFEVLYNVNANGTTAGDDVVLELTAVPEPGTWAMMLAGMGMLIVLKRRRRRA
jgi:autotransporter-associated beta strand protein